MLPSSLWPLQAACWLDLPKATHVRVTVRGAGDLQDKLKVDHKKSPGLELPADAPPCPSHRQQPIKVPTGAGDLIIPDDHLHSASAHHSPILTDSIQLLSFSESSTFSIFMLAIEGPETSPIFSIPCLACTQSSFVSIQWISSARIRGTTHAITQKFR